MARHGAALVALSEEKMFLRVGLAHIGTGERGYPDKGLWYGLDIQNVEREPASLMNEPRPHGTVGVVEIDGGGAEPRDRLAFRERAVCHRSSRLCGNGGCRQQN